MVALASSLLIILSMVVLLRPHGEKALALPGLESDLLAIRLGLVEVPAETVSIRPDLRQKYAVQQIPTTDERIVFYMVGSR